MEINNFNEGLLNFLQASPTPFHAVAAMRMAFEQAGFTELHEEETWPIEPGGAYFVIRNHSSIIAFQMGAEHLADQGFRMMGAHTDSPCLKIKPNPTLIQQGYMQLGVEVYGGALLNPWFDRDLSIAGRVHYLNSSRHIQHQLIDFERPIAIIPSLAIHLDREVNKNRSINPQTDLPPLLLRTPSSGAGPQFEDILLDELRRHPDCDCLEILDYDLHLYDTQPATLAGVNREFITGARLDNLLSCYVGLISLLNTPRESRTLLVCNDHEEVGSLSSCGANGAFLQSVLRRLFDSEEAYYQGMAQSFLISSDNAHGIHPNYPDKHDKNHGPILNNGPVLKINANQSYATTSETGAFIKLLAREAEENIQCFVSRTDMACGSTIGPISSAKLGIKTVDVGVPQFAMHSIRETAGSYDAFALYKLLNLYFRQEKLPFMANQ